MAKNQIKQVFEWAKKDWRIEKLYEWLKWWLTRKSAIAYAGLNLQTVYDWMEKMSDFSKKVCDSEEYWMAVVENVKRKKIVEEKYRPAIELELKSKRKKIYWDRLELAWDAENPIQVADLSNKTPKELETMRKLLLSN